MQVAIRRRLLDTVDAAKAETSVGLICVGKLDDSRREGGGRLEEGVGGRDGGSSRGLSSTGDGPSSGEDHVGGRVPGVQGGLEGVVGVEGPPLSSEEGLAASLDGYSSCIGLGDGGLGDGDGGSDHVVGLRGL